MTKTEPTPGPGENTVRVRKDPADAATVTSIEKVAPAADASYVLRFISGPRGGVELPLHGGHDYVFGRGKEADLVLAEDLVSRRHALLSLQTDPPMLSDLGSTNGTFINGERVSKAPLRIGDRLLIGTSIARLLDVDEEDTRVGSVEKGVLEQEKRLHLGSTMAGRLEEVPPVDLLQLFSNSRKSGTLIIRGATTGLDGEVRLQLGKIASARITGKPLLGHRKALGRLIRVEAGAFEFVPPSSLEELPVPAELQEPTEMLLMDAIRQGDELKVIEPELPRGEASLAPAQPLPGRLRLLEADSLDLFQLVLEHRHFGSVVDHSQLDDVEAIRGLLRLLSLGYLTVQA